MKDKASAQRLAVLLQSLDGGGSQRRVVDLVNGFVALEREVDLLSPRARGILRGRLARSVRVIELNTKDAEGDLADYVRHSRPDAMMAGAAAIHALAVKASHKSGHIVPLVLRASIHPHRYFPWALPRQRLLEFHRRRQRIQSYRAADLVIAVSDDIARTLSNAVPRAKIVTIPNPTITPSFLEGADAEIDWPWKDGDGPVIIGVGRFAVAKDFPTLLRAFAIVCEQLDARLVIIGSGSVQEQRALFALAERLGVSKQVAFPGLTDDVAAWLRRSDLFVSSSLWEGAQGALIEALAMGRPVIATSCVGSARDLLTNRRLGRLVPPRDPKLMARAILAELKTKRDPASLKAAVEHYVTGGQAANYLAAIDGCVSTQ